MHGVKWIVVTETDLHRYLRSSYGVTYVCTYVGKHYLTIFNFEDFASLFIAQDPLSSHGLIVEIHNTKIS